MKSYHSILYIFFTWKIAQCYSWKYNAKQQYLHTSFKIVIMWFNTISGTPVVEDVHTLDCLLPINLKRCCWIIQVFVFWFDFGVHVKVVLLSLGTWSWRAIRILAEFVATIIERLAFSNVPASQLEWNFKWYLSCILT